MTDESYLYWSDAGRPDKNSADGHSGYTIRTYADRWEFKQKLKELPKKVLDDFPELLQYSDRFTSSFERMFLFDSVSWSSLSYKLSNDDTLPYSSEPVQRPFKFAAIQSGLERIEIKPFHYALKFDDEVVLEADPSLGAWKPKPGLGLKRWAKMFVRQIEVAIENDADVICAGEFGWPPLEKEGKLDQRIRKALSNAKHPVFLIGGSRHNPIRLKVDDTEALFNQNIGMIYTSDPRSDRDVEPREHQKKSPAIRIGERIFTGNEDSIQRYNTPFGNFGVLICSDAFDLRILMSYLRDNPGTRPGRAEMIFVPSFNSSEKLLESCRYLSYLANCAVVYVNSSKEDFENESVKFFIAGFEREDVSKFIRHHPKIFPSDTIDAEFLYKWVRFRNCVDVAIPFTKAGKKQHAKRSISFFEIDTVAAQEFSSASAKAAGALLRTAIGQDEGKKFKI